ncbi:MAG: hypothetical protein Ctma_1069 [Catillopecten margaritatus gill symbiont]|uniref:Peptidyl-prolyl cis-trans isomerase n=1 Tax=Catillopecten margaritatus gill symbiont TaxID=3083288 RepID=A0AAU6PH52_9GAMM
MIIFKTNMGDIHIELDAKKAPITAKNFTAYVKSGFYDDTIFHRVIKNFMVQGGGFDENMKEKPTKKEIKNEANNGLKNAKYTVAMARTMIPHSASSQFFINTSDNGFLDYPGQDGWGYCVFGEVVKGHKVVDKINAVATGHQGMHADVPNEVVIVIKATVKASAKKKPIAKKPTTKKKVVAKKPVTKKAVAKKTVTKKPATKKIPTKKAVAKKATAKKPVVKKAATKKATPKKPAAKKTTTKKTLSKKPVTKKTPVKKVVKKATKK